MGLQECLHLRQQLLLLLQQRLLQRLVHCHGRHNGVDLGLRQLQGSHSCPPEIVRWLPQVHAAHGRKGCAGLQHCHGNGLCRMAEHTEGQIQGGYPGSQAAGVWCQQLQGCVTRRAAGTTHCSSGRVPHWVCAAAGSAGAAAVAAVAAAAVAGNALRGLRGLRDQHAGQVLCTRRRGGQSKARGAGQSQMRGPHTSTAGMVTCTTSMAMHPTAANRAACHDQSIQQLLAAVAFGLWHVRGRCLAVMTVSAVWWLRSGGWNRHARCAVALLGRHQPMAPTHPPGCEWRCHTPLLRRVLRVTRLHTPLGWLPCS
jgi:hypothetical protein